MGHAQDVRYKLQLTDIAAQDTRGQCEHVDGQNAAKERDRNPWDPLSYPPGTTSKDHSSSALPEGGWILASLTLMRPTATRSWPTWQERVHKGSLKPPLSLHYELTANNEILPRSPAAGKIARFAFLALGCAYGGENQVSQEGLFPGRAGTSRG